MKPILIFLFSLCIDSSWAQHTFQISAASYSDSLSSVRIEPFDMDELALPIALVYAGVAVNGNHSGSLKQHLMEDRNKYFPTFRTYADDYLQFAPIAAAYGLDALGYPSRTDLGNRTVILIKGEMAMFGITQLLKRTIRQQRPDGSNFHSFPSGHTA